MAIDQAIVSNRFHWLWICHEPDKASGTLITYKEKKKRKENLSRGNSIALALFCFRFLCFWLSEYFACLFFSLFEKIRMCPL